MSWHAGVFAVIALSAVSMPLRSQPIEIGHYRQLFFDNRVIEETRGLKRVAHPAEKYEGNPIMVKEKPWEGSGPYLYGTVLRDEDDGIFKMWYHTYVGGRPDYFTLYATSEDGIDWQRPEFNVVDDPRLTEPNNVVILGSGLPNYRQPHSPSVIYTPWDPDPGKRYKMLYWDISSKGMADFAGLCAAFSSDGIHWVNYEHNPVFDVPSDVNCACWDPIGKRYLLHHKMWHVEGDVVNVEGVDFPVGNISYWQGFNGPEEVDGKWRVWGGRVVDYSTPEPRSGVATVDYAHKPLLWRCAARAESKDFIHWGNIKIIFDVTAEQYPQGLSYHGRAGFPYEGMYIGLLHAMYGHGAFHNAKMELPLVYSYDDIDWRFCDGLKPFIGVGQEDGYTIRHVFPSTVPVVVGDELWFYYGAFQYVHRPAGKTVQVIQTGMISLAKLRRDGFVSLDAAGTGEIVTKPLVFEGDRLVLNIACEDQGSAMVELLDAEGEAISGFTRRDCDRITGDSVGKIVTWRGNSDVGKLAGTPIRLRIRLRKARLYAFGFEKAE